MNDDIQSLIGVVTLIIVLAIIVVLVKGQNFAGIVQSASSAFDTLLGRSTQQSA